MLYPENCIDKLGFTDIKSYVKNECLSDYGKEFVDRIQFLSNPVLLERFLRQTAEFKTLLEHDAPFPAQNFFDLRTELKKISIEGAWLIEEEFFRLHGMLTSIFQCIHYFEERKGQYLHLEALYGGLERDKSILKLIEKVIDSKGKMRSNASAALQQIIDEIAYSEREAHKRLHAIFNQAGKEGWTGDGNLTIREGRLSIPILAEYKRKIKGYILDESATGQTVYLEPAEVFELNNRIRDLEFEKRREMIRILTQLTTEVRPYKDLIFACQGLVAKFDFIRAKALFAIRIHASMPVLLKEPVIKLYNAYHPLLFINHQAQGQQVIPLSIQIDKEQRIVMVSGPNAGGKSVCLKTVGLLQIMLQSGLLIPAADFSEVGIFKGIFADIGDDQSIESDLSTYSAHLSKMKYFLENAREQSLILIDEFGTGTDPQFGGPIAEAVLQLLNQKKVRGVITTHYSNLKLFANHEEGITNASMLFDNKELRPLYQLEIGKPGSSYAFEIAQKIGLPEHVLNLARKKTGENQKRVDTLLVDLEKDKTAVYAQQQQQEKLQRKLEALIAENEQQKAFYTEHKKNLLREAKQEAKQVISNTNKLIENTIREIKESNADKEKTKQLREQLTTELNQLADIKPAEKQVYESKIVMNDWVKLIDSDAIGQVVQLSKKTATIAVGDMLSVIPLAKLVLADRKAVKQQLRSFSGYGQQQPLDFNPYLDVRGKRTDEALFELEKALDRALMLGINSLQVLHGKGDGILRKMIRAYLSKFDAVAHFEDDHPDRGGAAITQITLK